jgi:hypothetical protein
MYSLAIFTYTGTVFYSSTHAMQKNSTDYIALLSWEAVTTQWKAFLGMLVLPWAILIVLGVILGLTKASTGFMGSFQDWIAFIQLGYLACILYFLVYGGATSKWCESLFAGQKNLSIKEGMRYGLSRLGGSLGTTLLTLVKCFLWLLLFFLPGIYKMFMYSMSIQISHLEKISGGDANRLSQKLIKEAGPLRTVGNYSALAFLFYLVFVGLYIIGLLSIPAFAMMNQSEESIAVAVPIIGIILSVLFVVVMLGVTVFAVCFRNFQYLVYREENKAYFQKAIKELQSIKG